MFRFFILSLSSQIAFLEIEYRCYFFKIRYSDFNYSESKF